MLALRLVLVLLVLAPLVDASPLAARQELHADATAPHPLFGGALAGDAATLLVWAGRADVWGERAPAAVHIFAADEQGALVREHIFEDPIGTSEFGWRLAIEGDTAIVSGGYDDAWWENQRPRYPTYVLERVDGVWTHTHTLDGARTSVTISGNTIAMGATRAEVRIFERAQDGSWTHSQTLASPLNTRAGDFGMRVALEGDTLVVSEPTPHEGIPPLVHLYRRVDGAWSHLHARGPPDGATRGGFGASLALDGARLLVGAPTSHREAPFAYLLAPQARDATLRPGVVFSFAVTSGGLVPQGRLDAPASHSYAGFGTTVALADDIAFVGAPGPAGSVHAFRFDGLGAPIASFAEASTLPLDQFGVALAVVDDGLAVGRTARNFGCCDEDTYRTMERTNRDGTVFVYAR